MTYTALVLTDDSHDKLLAAFRDRLPPGWKPFAHHMTINMGPIKPDMEHLLGQFTDLIVKSFAMDDKVAAVGVVTDVPTKNDVPHITLAVNVDGGGKPFFSNKLTDWEPVEPITLRGRVEEV